MAEILKQGTCEFKIVKDVSKKSGSEYKCIKLVFGDYELSTPLFVNDDQIYLISEKSKDVE